MRLSRRDFLGAAGLAAAGLVPPASAYPADPVDGPPLRDLPEVRSRGGVLDYALTMSASTLDVGGQRVHVDTYNGLLPGPLLRVRPGDRLRVRLTNLMRPMGIPPGATPPATGHEPLHGTMITTNLHTHGLQVSPQDPADNVFLRIPPLGSHQYSYQIPIDQPAGLLWYHPHYHGSTTHQAWQGLAGPLIVEGDLDEIPELAGMRERTLVINALWLDQGGENPTALVLPSGGPVPFTSIPAVPTELLFPVNGQLRPDIHIRPGETQRWRILNAAPHRAMWLHIDQHGPHQIGQDGIPFARPRSVAAIMLASGNRAELVIQGGAPGRYRIYAKAYDQGHPGGPRPTRELATLVVSGPAATGRIPARLVDPPRMPRQPVAHRRTIRFSGDISGRAGPGVTFLIDGRAFDPDRIDQAVEAGTVEEWTLVNEDVFQHPIHIHVNPFQVIDVHGIPPGDTSWQTDPTIWWDTFRLPPKGTFTLRTYFRPDATGKTVYHCHILPHEDTGMMGTLLINPPGGAP